MLHYTMCLKCGNTSEIVFGYYSTSSEQKREVQKEVKKGCFSCRSKKLEIKITDEYGGNRWTVDECSQCHLPRIMDILNWEEVKSQWIRMGSKTKQEAIKKMNKEFETFCYCDIGDNERERAKILNLLPLFLN